MRPINRGAAPRVYADYKDADQDLKNAIGSYCSYCERRIPTNLAVEHILPKDPTLGFAHLRNNWANFLLACVNCNSAKKTTVITFNDYVLPDRDNTFECFEYLEIGLVESKGSARTRRIADNTIDLVNLNRFEHPDWDENITFSAMERFGQRIQAWVQAVEAREDYDNGDVNVRRIASEAASCGFFSIWMKAFEGVSVVRNALIRKFANTAINCFDANGDSVTPRPNDPTLQNSGKV
jgi:uncharacterized protein (TIGR02646 family)